MSAVDYNIVRLGFRKKLLSLDDELPPLGPENRAVSSDKLDKKRPMFVKEMIHRGTQQPFSHGFLLAKPQVSYLVHAAVGIGTELPDALANKIAALFPASRTAVIEQGYEMVVERTWQGDSYQQSEKASGQTEATWYVVPVHVLIRLFVPTF